MSSRAWMARVDPIDPAALADPLLAPPRGGGHARVRVPLGCPDGCTRLYIVGLWCLFGMLANFQWNFYSPIAEPVKAVYGMSDGMIS